jgi:hypothetical protein
MAPLIASSGRKWGGEGPLLSSTLDIRRRGDKVRNTRPGSEGKTGEWEVHAAAARRKGRGRVISPVAEGQWKRTIVSFFL